MCPRRSVVHSCFPCSNPWSAWASKRRCVPRVVTCCKVVQVVFHVSTSNHSIFKKNHKKPFPFPIFVINDTFREWILSFPVKSVPLHSRKLTLMSLFGNGHDYKKGLLFTATYIKQVKQSHKDCNWN